ARAGRLLVPLLIATRFLGIKPGSEARLTEFIIEFSFLVVAQNIICGRHILKLVLGVFVSWIDVGVKLARELAVRLTDVISRGATLDAEDLVVIVICHISL